MHDNPSLLGQFFSRIKGSQEDIATEGLSYIFGKSDNARNAFAKIIKNQLGIQLPELTFHTQAVGLNLERPDIVGYTTERKEVVIIESKFWSSLTSNQPSAYINRFTENDTVLIFICPSLRIRSLWAEIKGRLPSDFMIDDVTNHASQNSKHVIIKSWREVLLPIRDALVQQNEAFLVSDIDQIIGFCNVIDQNTFLPFTDKDLSPEIPRRISSYYDLVDKILDEMKSILPIDLSGMKATPQRTGYNRYFKYKELGLSLQLNFKLWKDEFDTPFWLSFQRFTDSNLNWRVDEVILQKVRNSGKNFHLFKYYTGSNVPHYPLLIPRDVTEDLLIQQISSECVSIIKFMAGD